MPARPKLATKEASETRFPTWDELVAEAKVGKPPYQLPLPDGKTIEIHCPDGDKYLDLVAAQRQGNAVGIFQAMFPDSVEQIKMRKLFAGADFTIIDVLAGKVLRYYYGLSIETEADDLGKLIRLVSTVDRFGRAIEADFLHEYGVDLLSFIRDERPWAQFWRLLQQLPGDSRYHKAQQQDEELAASVVADEAEQEASGEEPKPWLPAAQDWTLLHEMLAQIFDRLGDLAMVTAHAKPETKGPSPFPRPVTALSKAREAAKQTKLDRYDSKLLDVVSRAQRRYREMSEEERNALGEQRQQPPSAGVAGELADNPRRGTETRRVQVPLAED